MIGQINGCKIIAPLYESANSLVYRGIREQDGRPVILKVLKEDYPTAAELVRYKQEYEITRHLNLDRVVKAYSLEPYERTLVITLEDFGASSLKQLTSQSKAPASLPLGEFLPIAIQIAESLGDIHAANIIHKDINPANIVCNPETGQLKIIDFGISTHLSRENPTLKNPNVLEGTLAYISPEQTGRMNRSLDYRTDFYSLGVTFYELLTGQLPFETADALDLVHCHIAKIPVPPHQVNPEIPPVLSDIVMKLMAKTAEERYQSAWGLKADLEECLTQLQAGGNISAFPLASKDISDKFQIPQKLYGREAEVETLLSAFERVANSPEAPIEMMLVGGYSGIGKSSLIAEIHKPNARLRGYFISGKFDQFQRNIPYSAIAAAFQELVRQLLAESEAELSRWREKLLTAFGENGQAIADVIPEVELIVGQQPPVTDLGPIEAQNRFNMVFQKFIRAFCSREHPLVIFLDDLQWADSATLKLIELIMTDSESHYLFLIGAYRDNEVSPTHPLMMTLDGLSKKGAAINFITLTSLELEHATCLIADTLHGEPDAVKSLAELVVKKTGGNPFFLNQFLKTLHAENLITFDFERQCWQWNVAEIEAAGITDNVVELTIAKLKKLPIATQQVLRLAACAGASFDLNTLAIVCESSPAQIFQDLTAALQEGLILPTSELDSHLLIQNYKFLHDRVQQAAYALIDDAQKQAVHLKIGRLLLQNTAPEALSEALFEIVDHLNLGIGALSQEQERLEIAKLNLMAGEKAKAATAYGAAFEYLSAGRSLLSEDSWETAYDLTLALHEQAAEAAYLFGDFTAMEQLAAAVLDRAKTALEKVKVYEVKIQAAASRNQLKEALKIGLAVLELLGVPLLEEPTPADLQTAMEETASLLAEREIETLIDLPEMAEPEALAAILILSNLIAAAYIAAPDLLVLISASMVNLSIQYGNAPLSAFSYACYGCIVLDLFQNFEVGYKLGKVALSLVERFHAKKVKCKVYEVLGAHILHWKDHYRETIPILIEGYQSGVETGDFEFAGYCAFYTCDHLYFSAPELGGLEREIATYNKAVLQIRRESPFLWISVFLQAVRNLRGQAENPALLIGDACNEEEALPRAIAANDRTQLHMIYLNKLILSYLFGETEKAAENAVLAEQYLNGVTAMIVIPNFYFYDSLAHLSLCSDRSSRPEALLERVERNQAKMRTWAHHAPANHQHKFCLVEAETARILGQILEAEEFYERAIQGAANSGFIQEEALAYELAAKFYLGRSRLKIAQTYMKEAHYAYTRWGATSKVRDIETRYPQLMARVGAAIRPTDTTDTKISATIADRGDRTIDLASVIKASQAIGSEIVLEQLLGKLMKILIANAGAQVGYLILESNGKLFVEAEGAVGDDNVAVLQSIPIENRLPAALVNYVARTGESLVLSDAAVEGNFTKDSYIQQYQPKSILCFPFSDRGKIVSIVYMENNLTAGAFTPDRVEVLKILSAQAAISIENARLYQTLEDKVKDRTAQLARANDEISALNELLKAENLRMSAELEVTKQLQKMILPKPEELESIEGLEIAGFMEPADEVGGDYYDVLQQDGKVKIGIGDVTGHGLESGVLMLMTQTAVRTLQESNQTDPVQFLDILNRTLYRNAQRINPYRNLTLTLLDYEGGTLSASGQHEEIIIVRASGELERIETRHLGFPIALEEEIADFIDSKQVQLSAGDVVVLYTDGVTEAFNMERQQYGLQRLCEVVKSNCSLSAEGIREAIIEDVRRHIGEQKLFDDVTLLVLKQK